MVRESNVDEYEHLGSKLTGQYGKYVGRYCDIGCQILKPLKSILQGSCVEVPISCFSKCVPKLYGRSDFFLVCTRVVEGLFMMSLHSLDYNHLTYSYPIVGLDLNSPNTFIYIIF